MTRKHASLVGDEGAVSEVIGVILMVAITVIIAAVIGAFVLGFGDQVSESAPKSTIVTDSVDADADTITFKHGGGDSFNFQDTDIRLSTTGSGSDMTFDASNGNDLRFSPADLLVINVSNPDATIGSDQAYNSYPSPTWDLTSGDEVTVTFVDADSGQIIAEKSVTV